MVVKEALLLAAHLLAREIKGRASLLLLTGQQTAVEGLQTHVSGPLAILPVWPAAHAIPGVVVGLVDYEEEGGGLGVRLLVSHST